MDGRKRKQATEWNEIWGQRFSKWGLPLCLLFNGDAAEHKGIMEVGAAAHETLIDLMMRELGGGGAGVPTASQGLWSQTVK